MRAAVVWMVAAVCGVAAFGATLVSRAPKVERVRRLGGHGAVTGGGTMMASGMVPRDLEGLREMMRSPGRNVRQQFMVARRLEWAGAHPSEIQEAWRTAQQLASDAVKSPPDGRAALSWFVLGEASLKLREPERAREAFPEAVKLYKNWLEERGRSPTVLYRLGWCCKRMEDGEGAAEYFGRAEDALAGDVAHADTDSLQTLAAVQALLGEREAALVTIRVMLERGWDDRAQLAGSDDFAELRGDPRFNAFLRRLERQDDQERMGPPVE